MNGPVLNRTAAVGRMEVGYRHPAGEGDVVRRIGEVARGLQDGDVDRVAGRTARVVRPNGVHREREVDRGRAADDTVAEVETGWQVRRDGPVGGVATRDRREERGHLHATNQGHVFGVVVEDDDGLNDGDVERVVGRTTAVVGPHGEHRGRHVDGRCSRNGAVREVQTNRKCRLDGPVVHDACVDWEHIVHGNTTGEREIFGIVFQRDRRVVDGNVEVHHVRTARVVAPDRVHRGILNHGGCSPNTAVGASEIQTGGNARLDGPRRDVSTGDVGHEPVHRRVVEQRQVVGIVGEHGRLMKDGEVEVRIRGSSAVQGGESIGGCWPQLGRCTPNGAVAGLEGQTGRQAGVEPPQGDLPRTGDGWNQWEVAAHGVFVQREVGRRVGHGRQLIHHGDVEVGHARATAVVRPNHVGGLWPHFGRCAPNRTVARLEGQAAWQAGVDFPRDDFTRSGQGRIQRQVRADGVVGQREVRWNIGDGGELVEHGDVEIGLGGPTAVVGPDHVGRLRPQFGRCAPNRTVARLEGQAAWQAGVNFPRRDFTRTSDRRYERKVTACRVVGQIQVVWRVRYCRDLIVDDDGDGRRICATRVAYRNRVGRVG